ncbi:MAG TPA: Rrf2 family transcriptional regulator [Candidatus Hydrogenedentes bacterium]|nr:Rrf2 family transcriptional regulator [Candidatus Hydrogenedentota bacterium]HNT88205.1 Rrf2 family transcriptional regulator [Candidatus Hydrogenedentota bacterium]
MLSTTSEYALRALIELANVEDGHMMFGKSLSERAGIPAGYLSKILAALGRAGIIDATRGMSGGYQLAKPAKDILLIDVIEVFEGVRSRPACILDKNRECDDEKPCPAHDRFQKTRQSYLKFLEETSIAAIAKRRTSH